MYLEGIKMAGWFGIVFGIVIVSAGVVGLGNELHWWNLVVPWWPIILIALGLWILLGAVERKLLWK